MALKTLGTLATTTLHGAQFSPDPAALSAADFASVKSHIFYDQGAPGNLPSTIFPGAFSRDGWLTIPDRGRLQFYPGDWVAYGPEGCVLLIPQRALPKTLTATGDTHTSTKLDNMSSNVHTLGWQVGTVLSSSNSDIPAGTQIAAISADGKTITLSAAATGTNAGGTITAGSFTHS